MMILKMITHNQSSALLCNQMLDEVCRYILRENKIDFKILVCISYSIYYTEISKDKVISKKTAIKKICLKSITHSLQNYDQKLLSLFLTRNNMFIQLFKKTIIFFRSADHLGNMFVVPDYFSSFLVVTVFWTWRFKKED